MSKEDILDKKLKGNGIRKGWVKESKQAVLDAMEEYAEQKLNQMSKVWNVNPPKADMSVICRMNNGYIKMCHWTGTEWLDMWKHTLDGEVKEWMYIPYDKL